jgi:hypothetical protein
MSSGYEFTHSIKNENGVRIIHDIDCNVEVDPPTEANDYAIEVIGVWVNDVEIMRSKSPIISGIGCDIACAAEASEWLREKIYEDDNILYVGRGPSDPDGRLVQF